MKTYDNEHLNVVVRSFKTELPLELTFNIENDGAVDILEINDSGWVYYKPVIGDTGEIHKTRTSNFIEELVKNNDYLVDYAVRRIIGY